VSIVADATSKNFILVEIVFTGFLESFLWMSAYPVD
jgi:hypothetical protein